MRCRCRSLEFIFLVEGFKKSKPLQPIMVRADRRTGQDKGIFSLLRILFACHRREMKEWKNRRTIFYFFVSRLITRLYLFFFLHRDKRNLFFHTFFFVTMSTIHWLMCKFFRMQFITRKGQPLTYAANEKHSFSFIAFLALHSLNFIRCARPLNTVNWYFYTFSYAMQAIC